MFFKVISYIVFLLQSTNKHGVHSPFTFDLIVKCFNKKIDISDSNQHLKYRKKLRLNKNSIAITDFGAGSKVFKDNIRPIHKIAKYAGLSRKRANLLINIVQYFKPETILEFGTSVGLATAAMRLGSSKAKIITLEGCPNTMDVAKNQFGEFAFDNIETVTGEFDSSLNTLNLKSTLDFVYFDGNHQKEATLKYFEYCLQHINNNSVFVFDDIHWSKSMEEAWGEIKKHPKVKVTIDTFQWGIVFFRKEQEKEHFTIRV
ncbi:MAG: putative O-methyltransferase YrrM [Polaribacter sp.]|jgi:predicted O-methyltransferase YrrM